MDDLIIKLHLCAICKRHFADLKIYTDGKYDTSSFKNEMFLYLRNIIPNDKYFKVKKKYVCLNCLDYIVYKIDYGLIKDDLKRNAYIDWNFFMGKKIGKY